MAYRVEAVEDALRLRPLFGTTVVPWATISRVDVGRENLTLVSDKAGTRIERES